MNSNLLLTIGLLSALTNTIIAQPTLDHPNVYRTSCEDVTQPLYEIRSNYPLDSTVQIVNNTYPKTTESELAGLSGIIAVNFRTISTSPYDDFPHVYQRCLPRDECFIVQWPVEQTGDISKYFEIIQNGVLKGSSKGENAYTLDAEQVPVVGLEIGMSCDANCPSGSAVLEVDLYTGSLPTAIGWIVQEGTQSPEERILASNRNFFPDYYYLLSKGLLYKQKKCLPVHHSGNCHTFVVYDQHESQVDEQTFFSVTWDGQRIKSKFGYGYEAFQLGRDCIIPCPSKEEAVLEVFSSRSVSHADIQTNLTIQVTDLTESSLDPLHVTLPIDHNTEFHYFSTCAAIENCFNVSLAVPETEGIHHSQDNLSVRGTWRVVFNNVVHRSSVYVFDAGSDDPVMEETAEVGDACTAEQLCQHTWNGYDKLLEVTTVSPSLDWEVVDLGDMNDVWLSSEFERTPSEPGVQYRSFHCIPSYNCQEFRSPVVEGHLPPTVKVNGVPKTLSQERINEDGEPRSMLVTNLGGKGCSSNGLPVGHIILIFVGTVVAMTWVATCASRWYERRQKRVSVNELSDKSVESPGVDLESEMHRA